MSKENKGGKGSTPATYELFLWRPVRTIPTDGTAVIVGGPGIPCIEVCVIIPKGAEPGETEWYHDGDYWDGYDEVTHWMPRPRLPGERPARKSRRG